MNYLSTAQLAERPGARELAQVATADHHKKVEDDLMEATLRGADRSAWPTDETNIADGALARITDAITEAESIIDGFLAQRGYTLPLSPVPPLVVGWARDITRYFLHKHRLGEDGKDPISRGYRDATRLLQQTSQGKFSLGAADPVTTGPDAIDVIFESDPNVFGRDQLNKFR